MTAGKHIVVCGAGVIGLSVAHYALQRGHRVTVLERGAEDHDSCSLGNAGIVAPSHFTPLAAPGMVAHGLRCMLDSRSSFYVQPRLDPGLVRWGWLFARSANAGHVARSSPLLRDLNLASRGLFQELAAATHNDFELVQRGLLMLCRTQRALDHEAKVAARTVELGLPARVLTPAEAAAVEPGATLSIMGAVHFQGDCHLTPQRFVASLTRLVRGAGAAFLWSREVNGWARAGGRLVAARTDQGDVAGDEFVLAGGSWSAQLVRELGVRLPLQPGKGYSLTLERPRQLPQLTAILSEAHVAVTPMGSALRVGGTMELSGFNPRVRRERVRQIVESVPKYFPEFREEDFAATPAWWGYRPCSPDGLPFIGRLAAAPNLCVATGHAMLGLSLAPITGRLVAEIVSDEKPSIPIEALRPERFG